MRIKYLVLSDVHLGHRKTPTSHIITNLKQHILANDKKDLDVIFIAGDFFDRLLELNNPDVHEIMIFIHQLLTFCITNRIKLRVLEGTAQHECGQSQMFIKVNEVLDNPCDLKYITTLHIEHIVDLGLHVLYIPDDWSSSFEVTVKDIEKALLESGIKQVDIAILHGHFKYQTVGLPVHSVNYDEVYFLNLVRYYVSIGHFHSHSHYERIVAQGSFDRLAHGEEEDKGYVVIELDTSSREGKWVFCCNSRAYTYKSIKVNSSMDISKLDKVIGKLEKGSHVRLLMDKGHVLNANFEELKLRYLDCNLKRVVTDKTESIVVAYIDSEDEEDLGQFVLNEGNLVERLREQIVSKGYIYLDRHWKLFGEYLGG